MAFCLDYLAKFAPVLVLVDDRITLEFALLGALLDRLADEEELVLEAALAVFVGQFGGEAGADTDLVMEQPADCLGFFQAVDDDFSLEVV